MIDYVYRAKNTQTGEIVKAEVKAESPQAAAKVLAKQSLFALEIIPKSQSNILGQLGIKSRVKSKERVLFTRQLATLINAGLPLARALRTAEEQVGSQALREVVGSIVAAVEGGSTLADAFAQHPKVFNDIYVSLVAAGEASGSLDKALMRLATQQEKDAAIISKVRSALIYPAIVLVLIVAVVGIMVATIVPQVAKLYHDLHKTLPLLTQGLMALSNFVTHLWWLTIVAVVLIVIGLRRLMATEQFKLFADKIKLEVPVIGPIMKKLYMARFTRTMNTLLASGIPMLQAMQTVSGAVANRLVSADIDAAAKDVRGGKSLSEALEKQKHFLALVPQMSKIGEESGAIDEMLGRAATYYEEEVDEAVRNLSTTLEPVMMVVLGGIIALVLGAVLWPVYSLVGNGNIGG